MTSHNKKLNESLPPRNLVKIVFYGTSNALKKAEYYTNTRPDTDVHNNI